jgi:hypothetical protein
MRTLQIKVVTLCECETWSLVVREEHAIRNSETNVLETYPKKEGE